MATSKLPKRDKQELINFLLAYIFTQLIKEPTRITDTSRTMIDLVFANNEHRIVKFGVVTAPLSDHFLVFCIIKAGFTTKAKPRLLENFKPTLFNDDLRNTPWHIVENEGNVDDALFSEVADQHAPVKRRRVKGIPLPWMNSQLSDTIKEHDSVIYCYGTSSKELSDKLNNDLPSVAKWLHYHKLTFNLDKTKCPLIGSNSERESKVDLTVSILDHSISNVRSFKYLGIHISSDFRWIDHIEHLTRKMNQRPKLLKRIKHLLPFRARLLFYQSLVVPLFEYADLVWGDEHNITLMSSLQVLQNKAAKVILNRPFYSSSTEALAVLKWLPLEKRRFQRRCVHVYKCINGLIKHDMDLIRQDVLHRHNTRNKGNFRLPRVKRNWGKQRTQYHAVSDFNSLSQTIKDSRNVNSFKRNVFKFLI
ncbi:uncharacterized protein LOC122963371 [Acropora millepora]|uniref:uncharacterized protein LOC122963371 n=1 Tax=Acropora millepora TaxID=45264 RepID=UPI001CF56EC2|nr:uncharacterized protein LOC122963371 [Acropora millepora]